MDRRHHRVLCITGMHRSGTSLVASWLQRCGLPIDDGRVLGPGVGNERGHFEDRDFYELEGASVTRQWGSWRVESPTALRFGAEEQAQAQALLAARHRRFAMWGWKDPRALLFMDHWKQLEREMKVLLLWRPCAEVVHSLRKRAWADRRNPDFTVGAQQAARIWRAHNEAALAIKRAYPRDVLLVSVRQVLAADRQLIARCNEAWGMGLSYVPIAELCDESLLRPQRSLLSRLAAHRVDARTLEQSLAASSDALG